MEERIKNYRKYLEDMVEADDLEAMKKAYPDILTQIGFFQHERFVHLLVTVTFALLAMLGLMFFISTELFAALILFLLYMGLLIPYIRHYYILENYTQRLYSLYDAIRERLGNA
jgi:ABC-type multidrug transport system fused ATPase/permease subunit